MYYIHEHTQKYNSDNHNDYDKKNQQCYNLLMVIYDNLYWYQLFVYQHYNEYRIRCHTKNGACLNPS